jgi:hypothetical protein
MIEIALDLAFVEGIFRGWCHSGEFTSLSAQNFESILHNNSSRTSNVKIR